MPVNAVILNPRKRMKDLSSLAHRYRVHIFSGAVMPSNPRVVTSCSRTSVVT
jgi:hypothetical protein